MAPSRRRYSSPCGADEFHRVFSPGPPVDFSFKGLKELGDLFSNAATPEPHPSTGGPDPTNVASQSQLPTLTAAASDDSTELPGVLKGPPGAPKHFSRLSTRQTIAVDPRGQTTPLSSATLTSRKSVCTTKSDRVVSVCSMVIRGQQNSVVNEVKESKIYVHLVTNAVKLNNNELTEAPDLPLHLSRLMSSPIKNLRWLDLSFNRITSIPPSLNELQNLMSLCLHYNAIANPSEVFILQKNQKLKFLTFIGNPFEEDLPGYRIAVAAALPCLKSLDYTPFSGDEFEVARRIDPTRILRVKPKSRAERC